MASCPVLQIKKDSFVLISNQKLILLENLEWTFKSDIPSKKFIFDIPMKVYLNTYQTREYIF